MKDAVLLRLEGFQQWVRERYPVAGLVRLQVLFPCCALALATSIVLGLSLPARRLPASAETLVPAKTTLRGYLREWRHFDQLVQIENIKLGSRRSSGFVRAEHEISGARREIPVVERTLVAIPQAAGLRHCAFDTDNDGAHYVACDGAGVADGDLTVPFISISVAAAICAVWWLYLQYRDSWMVPAWDSALWWTPTHACGIAAFVACPVVLVFTYFAHSSPGYVIGPSGWAAARPPIVLLVLVVLQVATITVASVAQQPSAVGFLAGIALLALSHLGRGGDLGTHYLRGRRDRDRLARPGSRREREDAGLSPSRLRPNAVPGARMGGLRVKEALRWTSIDPESVDVALQILVVVICAGHVVFSRQAELELERNSLEWVGGPIHGRPVAHNPDSAERARPA